MEKWRREWIRTAPTGGFARANKFPPSWKPRQHVWETSREVFSQLTQCRTKHGFIGEYYARFVPNKRTDCPCGEHLQTRDHIIQDCRRYETHREILREADENLDIGNLLGSKEGLRAMAKFLEKSGAFTKTGEPRMKASKPTADDEENDEGNEEEEEGEIGENGEGEEAGESDGEEEGEVR
ncbi:hypothetical protein J132_04417 [Termitomyces sp. J132]|nr:hypothetical protein J132_04417 [Termitomyces sp. J132]